ncbi:MAG: hypothetical protein SGILL_000933 [Bacillariaceae sp.]
MNNVNGNEDDEAMEAASNVMETTTNDSSSGSSNSGSSAAMDDAASEDNNNKEDEITMEDATTAALLLSSSNQDDTPMKDEEDNEEMTVAVPSASQENNDDEEEVDEPMEDKAELKEETMKTAISSDDIAGQTIPKKMMSSDEKLEEATSTEKDASQRPSKKDAVSPSTESLSLHDCLSLGEVEIGLENQKQELKSKDNNKEDNADDTSTATAAAKSQRATSEIHRLPYVLRLLSSTRPLASISVMDLLQQNNSSSEDKDADANADQKQGTDKLVDGVVDSLEDVAATYSIAEAVDVVTNHLAPSLTKKISRIKPLTRTTTATMTTTVDGVAVEEEWDTAALADVARDPITLPSKRKRGLKTVTLDTTASAASNPPEGGTMLSSDDAASEDGPEDGPDDEAGTSVPLKKRRQAYRRDSIETNAEDSQENTFTKTLAELASLVVRSLNSNGCSQNPGKDPSQQAAEDDNQTSGEQGKASFALRTDDSILSEHFRGANEGTGGAMEGSDLGSTVSAIMYHAPVLRSKHVASALCRASLQQTGDLLSRLAANCPASTPALLLGCIETYSMAIQNKHIAIAETAKECVTALAKLSRTECTRVLCRLQISGVMLDVQLRLAAQLGNFQLSCFIAQHLTPSAISTGYKNISSRLPIPRLERQLSRESSTEIPDAENEDLSPTSHLDSSEPTLLSHLIKNHTLYAETLGFFAEELSSAPGKILQSQGKWCLSLRALALLLLVPLTDAEIAQKMHQSFVGLIRSFVNVLGGLDINVDRLLQPDRAEADNIFRLFCSCGILLIARASTNADPANDEVVKSLSEVIFENVKKMFLTSRTLERSWISICTAVRDERTRALLNCVMEPISQAVEGTNDDAIAESILSGLRSFCRMFDTRSDATQPFDLLSRAGALLQSFDESSVRGTLHVGDTGDLLRDLLLTDANVGATSLVCSTEILQFIVEGTRLLDNEQESSLPVVLPSYLDKTWSQIVSGSAHATAHPTNDDESIYLLRLLYSLEYLDGRSSALCAVEPWSLPIKEAMTMARRLPSNSAKFFLLSELRRLVWTHCPDLNDSACFANRTQPIAPFVAMSREKLMEALYLSIRSIVNKEAVSAGDDKDVEFLFLQARSLLCDADLYCTVASACLSSPHSPTPRYSYSHLCRDPLVVLRYPLSVWSNKGLRRILLTTLRALILANNSISLNKSPMDSCAEELLVARDAIIVRCLLAVSHGGNSEHAQICSSTTSFLRWLISGRSGILGLLVKQGLEDVDVDWLVENVPEAMKDAQSLLQILSEKSCLTASERMSAADAISRIVIVHGGDFSDKEASQMTAVALQQLVESFYLILGPVGVPVNALLCDDSGTDATQSSRKAAFRILKALIRVRARRQAFHICGTGLQKLASLCKGESSSVQGAVAAKRKQLLKEVFDAASKAVGVSGSAAI